MKTGRVAMLPASTWPVLQSQLLYRFQLIVSRLLQTPVHIDNDITVSTR